MSVNNVGQPIVSGLPDFQAQAYDQSLSALTAGAQSSTDKISTTGAPSPSIGDYAQQQAADTSAAADTSPPAPKPTAGQKALGDGMGMFNAFNGGLVGVLTGGGTTESKIVGSIAAAGPAGMAIAGLVTIGELIASIFKSKDYSKDMSKATENHNKSTDALSKDSQKLNDAQDAFDDASAHGTHKMQKKAEKDLDKAQGKVDKDQKNVRKDNQRAYFDANKVEDGIRKHALAVQVDKDEHPGDKKRLDKDEKKLKDEEDSSRQKAGDDPNAQALVQKAIDAGELDVQIGHDTSNKDWKKHTQNNFFNNQTGDRGDKAGNIDPDDLSLSDLAANSKTLTDGDDPTAPGSRELATNLMAQLHPEDLASTMTDGLAQAEGVAQSDTAVAGGPVNDYQQQMLQAYLASQPSSQTQSA